MVVLLIGIGGLIGLILLASLAWLVWRPRFIGFGGKTLWDWMSFLTVPTILGTISVSFGIMQAEAERQRAEEVAVQAYFDRITALFADGLDSTVTQTVGRAHTLAVLDQVTGVRAGRVLSFLHELGLLERYASGLEGIDLADADLKGFSLAGADFEDSDLSRAELEDASLPDADFEGAVLRGTDLKNAVLRAGDFSGADLAGADLAHADLRGADLAEALGLTADQVGQACIDATTRLPPALRVVPNEAACAGPAPD